MASKAKIKNLSKKGKGNRRERNEKMDFNNVDGDGDRIERGTALRG
jgi:hypothetical protein